MMNIKLCTTLERRRTKKETTRGKYGGLSRKKNLSNAFDVLTVSVWNIEKTNKIFGERMGRWSKFGVFIEMALALAC